MLVVLMGTRWLNEKEFEEVGGAEGRKEREESEKEFASVCMEEL